MTRSGRSQMAAITLLILLTSAALPQSEERSGHAPPRDRGARASPPTASGPVVSEDEKAAYIALLLMLAREHGTTTPYITQPLR